MVRLSLSGSPPRSAIFFLLNSVTSLMLFISFSASGNRPEFIFWKIYFLSPPSALVLTRYVSLICPSPNRSALIGSPSMRKLPINFIIFSSISLPFSVLLYAPPYYGATFPFFALRSLLKPEPVRFVYVRAAARPFACYSARFTPIFSPRRTLVSLPSALFLSMSPSIVTAPFPRTTITVEPPNSK